MKMVPRWSLLGRPTEFGTRTRWAPAPMCSRTGQRGSTITLAANADYWGDAPSIDTVNYRFVEESGTRLAGLAVR